MTICFLLFVPSFYSNFWGIAEIDVDQRPFAARDATGDIYEIEGYDPYPNMLIMGRLAESKKNGVFSHAGLPGINYDQKTIPDSIIAKQYEEDARAYILHKNIVAEYHNFLEERESPSDFCPYASQVGGQGIVYSIINNTLPFSNKTNFAILKLINSILVSLAFVLFLGWSYRAFGLLASSVTFILIFITPWLILMGSGLWWSIWGLYIPFLAILLALERRHTRHSEMKDGFIFALVFLAVSLKCLFTGMEFITSSLVAIYSPIVYFFWQEKRKIRAFILFCFKVGISALLAVFTNLMILFFQLKSVMGGAAQALDYLVFAYVRRTEFVTYSVPDNIFKIVITEYLKFDAFNWGIINKPFTVCYFYIIGLVFVMCLAFYIYYRKKKDKRKYLSLSVATLFSFLSPLSWYYIFVQHSHQHACYDSLVWYIPFLLYGYLMFGVTFDFVWRKIYGMKRTN